MSRGLPRQEHTVKGFLQPATARNFANMYRGGLHHTDGPPPEQQAIKLPVILQHSSCNQPKPRQATPSPVGMAMPPSSMCKIKNKVHATKNTAQNKLMG